MTVTDEMAGTPNSRVHWEIRILYNLHVSFTPIKEFYLFYHSKLQPQDFSPTVNQLMLNVCLILLEDSFFLCIKSVMQKEKLSLTAGKMGIKYRYNSEALHCAFQTNSSSDNQQWTCNGTDKTELLHNTAQLHCFVRFAFCSRKN